MGFSPLEADTTATQPDPTGVDFAVLSPKSQYLGVTSNDHWMASSQASHNGST